MAAQPEHLDGSDRQRLLNDAAALLTALDDVRSSRELHHIRGELAELRDNVEHVRDLIERLPRGGLDIWQF